MTERRVQELRDKIEDEFINISEKGIRSGLSFEEAMKEHPEYVSAYGVWRDRYTEWQKCAPRPEYFSLQAEREAVKARRQKEAKAAAEEGFYQSNKTLLTGYAENKRSFEQTQLPEELRPHYERAYAEVWGRHAEIPKGNPDQDLFLAGFKYD